MADGRAAWIVQRLFWIPGSRWARARRAVPGEAAVDLYKGRVIALLELDIKQHHSLPASPNNLFFSFVFSFVEFPWVYFPCEISFLLALRPSNTSDFNFTSSFFSRPT
jgi:hypothetical protein